MLATVITVAIAPEAPTGGLWCEITVLMVSIWDPQACAVLLTRTCNNVVGAPNNGEAWHAYGIWHSSSVWQLRMCTWDHHELQAN